MTFLYSLFFGAGVAAFIYSTFARRAGYDNKQSVAIIVGAAFIFATIFFYTILAFVLHI